MLILLIVDIVVKNYNLKFSNGNITQNMIINGFNKDNINDYITKKVIDGKLVITIAATNQTVEFIPWMDCIYQRYSMYMYYKSK